MYNISDLLQCNTFRHNSIYNENFSHSTATFLKVFDRSFWSLNKTGMWLKSDYGSSLNEHTVCCFGVSLLVFEALRVISGVRGTTMNEDKLSDVDGCGRVSVLNCTLRRCRLARARCATSSCVSICSKTFLVVVNFVFLVSSHLILQIYYWVLE